jgi:hypothetical protein
VSVGDADAPANLPLSGLLLPTATPVPGTPAKSGGTPPGIDRRVLIKRSVLRADRKRRVKLQVQCGLSSATRCRGIAQPLWSGKRLLARRAFSVPTGGYRTVTLTLNADAYRRLKHKTLHVSIIVLTRGSDGVLRRGEQTKIRLTRS